MGITSGECMCVRGKKEQYGKLQFIGLKPDKLRMQNAECRMQN